MSLIRKHGAVLQAWACLDLVSYMANVFLSITLWDPTKTPQAITKSSLLAP